MTKHLDNTEFLSLIHDLISNTNECVVMLERRSEGMDQSDKELIGASITLLHLHTKLLTDLAERNATMLDHANTLLEQIREMEK